MKKINFPRDSGAHKSVVEWWYFNGNLQDKSGNRFSFMNCLFKLDVKKSLIPYLQFFPLKTLFSVHTIICDIEKKKTYRTIDYIVIPTKDSFSAPLLFAKYYNPLKPFIRADCLIEENPESVFHLKNDQLDLQCVSAKKPFPAAGSGYLEFGERSTYYYSYTNLKTKGILKIGKRKIEVSGKSWMDHQWADAPYSKDKWNWFCIQLDNGIEIICFEYGGKKKKYSHAGVCPADDSRQYSENLQFEPVGKKWKSELSGAEYQLSWKISNDDLKMDLLIKPLSRNEEMIAGPINYWECPIEVGGTFGKEKVIGRGFMEIVGPEMENGRIKIFMNEMKEKLLEFNKKQKK
ncbi:hypothetical protein KKC32_05280 [Patescibacteria group bacterium]|nr:hypothetical protein [Patescibacteria group bacterium]